ncbi:YchJ family protein [Pasteurellaceae bacterium 22721_9_1]
MTMKCPCQSGQSYSECCQPYHLQQQFPSMAEQLMRSRYAAYALKNIDYIVQTTAPSQQCLLDQAALQQWAEQTQWLGLQIVAQQQLSKQHSAVEFNAFFAAENGEQTHHEHSLFVQIDQRWYFVDPTVPLPTMKQACLCGSGKKFKHCCGGYL